MRRPSDVHLLYAARAARGFGDGFAIIILPAYLSELGFGPFQIGIIASAALLGTAAVTLAIGFFAPGKDLRNFCSSVLLRQWRQDLRSRFPNNSQSFSSLLLSVR